VTDIYRGQNLQMIQTFLFVCLGEGVGLTIQHHHHHSQNDNEGHEHT